MTQPSISKHPIIGALVVTWVILLGAGPEAAWAKKPIPKGTREKEPIAVEIIAEGFQAGREKLVRGMYHCTGFQVETDSEGSKREEYEIFAAFDYENDRFRFDRTVYAEYADEEVMTGRYISTPEHTIQWQSGWEAVGIQAPGLRPFTMADPFNVRLVGTGGSVMLNHNETVAPIAKALPRFNTTSQLKNLATISKVHTTPKSRWTMHSSVTFDTSADFSPVSFATTRTVPSDEGEPNIFPVSSGHTEWIEIEGVWLPEHYHAKTFPFRRGKSIQVEMELSFCWISINQPIPEEAFQVKGMRLPKGTVILRRGPDGPIIEGRAGEDD